jgi:hypothetical protein
MPTVMPSQVVAAIDQMFPFAASGQTGVPLSGNKPFAQLRALVTLVDEIPQELIAVSVADYSSLVMAKGQIELGLEAFISRGQAVGLSGDQPVAIRQVLAKCPDQFPPTASADLAFIADVDLRAALRQDIADATRAFADAEWKGATVLAGSIIEALLLWAIATGPKADILKAQAAAKANNSDPNRWDLAQFILGARAIGAITPETETAAGLAREFRNLIHPGRSERLKQKCDRGTAYLALGALDRVVTDVAKP